MFRKLFLFGLICIITLNGVWASSYSAEFIQEESKVLVREHYTLDNNSMVSLVLPVDAFSISSNSVYTLEGNVLNVTGKDIVISYITEKVIDISKSDYFFTHKIIFPVKVNSSIVKLDLKEGFVVDKEDIYPKGASVETDGHSIIIEWNLGQMDKGDNVALFVKFNDARSSSLFWYVFPIVISSIIIIVGIGFVIFLIRKNEARVLKLRKKVKMKEETEEDYISYLMESEKSVVKELQKSERKEAWQKQLQIATGFSKAKMSRVVRNLESRGIVEKIPMGNTNKVKLKK